MRSGSSLARILGSCISKFIIRNFGNQKAVGQYIQSVKKKKRTHQSRILYMAKLSFKNKVEIMIFPDKQKLKKLVTITSAVQGILKEVLWVEIIIIIIDSRD